MTFFQQKQIKNHSDAFDTFKWPTVWLIQLVMEIFVIIWSKNLITRCVVYGINNLCLLWLNRIWDNFVSEEYVEIAYRRKQSRPLLQDRFVNFNICSFYSGFGVAVLFCFCFGGFVSL